MPVLIFPFPYKGIIIDTFVQYEPGNEKVFIRFDQTVKSYSLPQSFTLNLKTLQIEELKGNIRKDPAYPFLKELRINLLKLLKQ